MYSESSESTAIPFNLIVAMDNQSTIGVREYGIDSLPWPQLKPDMDFFRTQTCKTESHGQRNAIIIGYNTWKTLPTAYRTNPCRYNIVISRDYQTEKPTHGETYQPHFEAALTHASELPFLHEIYVIGGGAVYDTALRFPGLKRIYLSHIQTDYPVWCQVDMLICFPLRHSHLEEMTENRILKKESESSVYVATRDITCRFVCYEVTSTVFIDYYLALRVPRIQLSVTQVVETPEAQYLDLVREIYFNGVKKTTRNGATRSIFGYQLKYDLMQGYPISTVKRSYPKAIFEELMWMIRGETDTKILEAKNVNIWKKNSTKEFLRSRNLPYREGDIGPGYGFQMRHQGATYVSCETDYSNQGVDQLFECIMQLQNDPTSRRIIIDLWNSADIDKMALPCCHVIYNFGVDLYDYQQQQETGYRGKLNCHLFQRSWDVLLGWNTTTAALFTYLLAHHCNLQPGTLVHSITDAHLYESHIDSGAIYQLLNRCPRMMPRLTFLERHDRIESYEYIDMCLKDYYPNPPISADMVA